MAKLQVKHSSLKINVSYKADTNSYFERLKEACKGSRIRETTYASLVDEFSDFGDLYTRLDEAKTVVGNLAPKFEQCIMDELPNLLTWLVPHEFTIEYQGRELRYHSLGQRASALMIFILSQYDNDLIFIDQPEDDLEAARIGRRCVYGGRRTRDARSFGKLLKLSEQEQVHARTPTIPYRAHLGTVHSPLARTRG